MTESNERFTQITLRGTMRFRANAAVLIQLNG
jgi:hypothetical protein